MQGATLSGPERRAIAEYLGGESVAGDATGAAMGRCNGPARFRLDAGSAWNGWGATPANERRQSAAAAGITAQQLPHLELKWALGFPDATSSWAQPTVVGGWVFVGSQNGSVYALDAGTGCIHWLQAAACAAISVGANKGGGSLFRRYGRAELRIDAASGHLLWKTKLETHPLAHYRAPRFSATAFACPCPRTKSRGARGRTPLLHVSRQRVSARRTRAVLWRTYMIAEEPREQAGVRRGDVCGPAGASMVLSTIDAKRGLITSAREIRRVAAPTSDAGCADALGKHQVEEAALSQRRFHHRLPREGQNQLADQSGQIMIPAVPDITALPHGKVPSSWTEVRFGGAGSRPGSGSWRPCRRRRRAGGIEYPR